MLVTGYWAEPFLDRERTRVFSPTLDSMIDKDDPVRLVDEILAEINWSDWEAEYNGHLGAATDPVRHVPRHPQQSQVGRGLPLSV
jgi:hypothetical protein